MSTEQIKLNFVNRADDQNNSSVVIFQQNVAEDFGGVTVAWKVIRNYGHLDNYPFVYSMNFEVCASDPYGNATPHVTAYAGQVFDLVRNESGYVLQLSRFPAFTATEVEVRNSLKQGAISANCYRDGKLLAAKRGLAPGQRAVFEFEPRFSIGVVSQIEEGDIINSAIISRIDSEIDLLGITSADIVMTGGGPRNNFKPFVFTLENICR